jgi:PAS domain S-box-containing protein
MINILKAITDSNSTLIREENINHALQSCIAALGKNLVIDRCYIFQNKVDNGVVKIYYEFEWCGENIEAYIGNPLMSGLPYEAFPGLYEPLSSNKPLFGIVNESKDPQFIEIMEMQGIKAYLFTPIFSNNEFWGWIGFDDCTSERVWSNEVVQALFSVANNIGLRLKHELSNQNLINALDELDLYIKSSKLAKWEWDLITNKVAFSYNWFGMLGYTDTELEQDYLTWKNNVHNEDIENIEKKINDFLIGNINRFEGVFRMIHKKGHTVWIKYSSLAIRDNEKKPIKLIGTHIDITDLKIKEIELKLSEDKFRFIAENSTDLICQHDTNGTFTYVSNSSQEIIGYLPEELIGKNAFDYFHPAEISNLKKRFENKSSNNNINTSTYQFIKKNGTYCWLEITSKLIFDENTETMTIQTSSRDITERIKAETEISNALQKERELNELKSSFVTMASHQFKTPLTVIYSNIELLSYKVTGIEKKVKNEISIISTRIINEIDRMTELMNNILIFGKFDSGNLKVEIKKFDLIQFITNHIETYFNNESDNRTVDINVFGKPTLIKSDENLLNNIVNNLISNALKYSKDCPNPIIKINFLELHFTIEFIDFGLGIPEIEKKHLFKSFFRASNTVTIKGSGLGLIIAKQFTELLNGTIEIKSLEKIETNVTLKFPYEN